jgi:hypothetical protein
MKNQPSTTFSLACLTIFLLSGCVYAQSNTLPLGQVNPPVKSVACPGGFAEGARCYSSTISCPDTEDIGFTYGIVNPSGKQGTIVFFNGEDGNTPGFSQYIAEYTPPAQNFQTVQVTWSTAWEETGNDTGDSLKAAACRPATLLDWLLNQKNVYGGGGMCAQGASAGSAAIAYALTEYGAYEYLNHVELESGPVLSDMSMGCNPKSPSLTVCPGNQCLTGEQGSWPDSPIYVDGAENAVSTWTGAWGSNSCANGSDISQSQLNAWKAMSIVDGLTGSQADSTFFYPKTSMTGWLCSKPDWCNGAWCQNNSAAEGQLYYQNVTSSKSVYRVNNCEGTEGVERGTVPELNDQLGLQAIAGSMIAQCGEQKRVSSHGIHQTPEHE